MIHIVFQQADIEVLKKAQELDESLIGDVQIVRDDYAVGPIQNIYEPEGYQARRQYWKELLDYSPYNSDQLMEMVDDRLMVHNLKRTLDENEDEIIWIWMGQNQHDVCGYYWLLSQLKDYHGRIFVLYLNNLPFINEKGLIFYPTALHQIQPKEFLKAKKLARKVTLSEFEVDPDEWKKLMDENGAVRILEGGKKIVSKEESFYDKDILAGLTSETQKGNKAMQNILSKMKNKTGDVTLLGRMKVLAEEGKIELTGEPAKGWKEFDVKLKSTAPEEVTELNS
ncbi:DUF1835 domain-containing protein [Flavisolibacter ginsenosidimutans]|uniref:DUF1835 domain-containing protein n=1 Tax=Flavisolibacter ginsenosidimutans TaxID=661481 RepID=A0A5B8UFA2_9BACT|nr:DUF1835 domain-containing protein [Flavisolibacter ginsenosidimutans]QEC55055.1 DUF1835 domain-containing protein [Flavisolibacter ginsenosidimutans]